MGRSAEQQRNLAPFDALALVKLHQPPGQSGCGRPASFVGVSANPQVQLDKWLADPFSGRRPVGTQRCKGHVVRVSWVVLGAEDRLEQGIGDRQQGVVRAEGEVQVNVLPTGGGHVGLHTAEYGHVRAAKPINGLFGIAHHKERSTLTPQPPLPHRERGSPYLWGETGQGIDNATLALVGVLELVHQHGADLGLPARPHGGVLGQERRCPHFQVVKV